MKKHFIVHTIHDETRDAQDLVKDMTEGGTGLSEADCLAALNAFFKVMSRELSRGTVIKLPFFSLYLSASGTFDYAGQAFDPATKETGHKVSLHFRANKAEEARIVNETLIQREFQIDKTAPCLYTAHSVRTDEELTASPGDFIRIHGRNMKFNKTQPETGVWFKNGSEHRAVQYASVTPGTVIAQVPPDLGAGQYSLIVRTSPNEKDIKEAMLSDPVSVA